jgi:deazaflavin-dependent oxidoreductase (nitroreductase family)
MEDLPEISRSRKGWVADHFQTYVESGGTRGHVVDVSDIGGYSFTTTLLLKTIGRRTGEARISPLVYGDIAGELVIVGSRGGAPKHPAWYFNIKAAKEVEFQVATECFRGPWREPEGSERQKIWDFMVDVFPPYQEYQKATDRQIPLVMLSVRERIDSL